MNDPSDPYLVEIVGRVMSRHSIDLQKDYIDAIATFLWCGNYPEQTPENAIKRARERHDRNQRRSELLTELLSLYPDPEKLPKSDGLGNEHIELSNEWLKSTICRLAYLRDVADRETREKRPAPQQKRPSSARLVFASRIYDLLRSFNIRPWKCCTLIAELMSESGLDERSVPKVKRHLYNKLKPKES